MTESEANFLRDFLDKMRRQQQDCLYMMLFGYADDEPTEFVVPQSVEVKHENPLC